MIIFNLERCHDRAPLGQLIIAMARTLPNVGKTKSLDQLKE